MYFGRSRDHLSSVTLIREALKLLKLKANESASFHYFHYFFWCMHENWCSWNMIIYPKRPFRSKYWIWSTVCWLLALEKVELNECFYKSIYKRNCLWSSLHATTWNVHKIFFFFNFFISTALICWIAVCCLFNVWCISTLHIYIYILKFKYKAVVGCTQFYFINYILFLETWEFEIFVPHLIASFVKRSKKSCTSLLSVYSANSNRNKV